MLKQCATLAAGMHFAALWLLSLYGCHRIWLLWSWWHLKRTPREHSATLPATLPSVTVQLPVYNERFVVARLIDATAVLDWPAELLEIQVLDDSTDDTTAIVAARVAHWQGRGIGIRHIRRSQRQGFKAGALAEGLAIASGELIAIFDADFIPPADFLTRTVPHFRKPRVGMVQTRWEFCNAEHSWLTRVQALLLAPHFGIEHQVRCQKGLFFNFNGTAGIWRRTAIEASGGWQSDTVTEDLDLSYRAQMAGWRFVYLDDYAVPSELPVTIAAFRGQQQRWAKGSVQTARKILPQLLVARLPFAVKIEATVHLLANGCWLLGTVVFLTLYPTVISRVGIGPWQLVRLDLPLFMATTGAILAYFCLSPAASRGRGSLSALLMLPVLSIGLGPGIALAVLQGVWKNGGYFARTPKFGIVGTGIMPQKAAAYADSPLAPPLLNLALLLYSLLPVAFAWQQGTWYSLPLFLLFPAGFLAVILTELRPGAGSPGTPRS